VSPPISPVLIRAVELLEDRAWHDYEATIRELARMVPPGKAIRRAERLRAQRGPAERYVPVSDERAIASGQRSIVKDSLHAPWFEVCPAGVLPLELRPLRRVRLVMVPAYIQRSRDQGVSPRVRSY
jgi:hypothetical protein